MRTTDILVTCNQIWIVQIDSIIKFEYIPFEALEQLIIINI